jgi:hypothetical protein
MAVKRLVVIPAENFDLHKREITRATRAVNAAEYNLRYNPRTEEPLVMMDSLDWHLYFEGSRNELLVVFKIPFPLEAYYEGDTTNMPQLVAEIGAGQIAEASTFKPVPTTENNKPVIELFVIEGHPQNIERAAQMLIREYGATGAYDRK